MDHNLPIFKFVTDNKDEFHEVRQFLSGNRFQIQSLELELDALQGEPQDILRQKCLDAATIIFKNNDSNNIIGIIIEETSFCLNALDGLPGPYIKSFSQQMKADDLIKIVNSFDDKSAYLLSTFAVALYKKGIELEVKIFQGRLDGVIVKPLNSGDSDWYSCLQPLDKTFPDLHHQKKAQILHKIKALEQVMSFLNSLTLSN